MQCYFYPRNGGHNIHDSFRKKGGGGVCTHVTGFFGPGGGPAQSQWIPDAARRHYPLVLLRFLDSVAQNVAKSATMSLSSQKRWGFGDRGGEISRG